MSPRPILLRGPYETQGLCRRGCGRGVAGLGLRGAARGAGSLEVPHAPGGSIRADRCAAPARSVPDAMLVNRRFLMAQDPTGCSTCSGSRPVCPPPRAAGGLGGAGERTARSLHWPLPLRLRPDVRQSRRPGGEGAGRPHGGGTGPLPGRPGQRLSERVPRGSCSTACGTANPRGPRGTPCTRSWPACSTCIRWPGTRRRWTCSAG